MPAHRVSVADRLEKYADRSGGPDACWPWTGCMGSNGYSALNATVYGRHIQSGQLAAYILSYGPVPDGMVVDHRCENRRCVNPAHLRAVTHRTNLLLGNGLAARNVRKTHCLNGHELAGENLRIKKDGSRGCKACHRHYNKLRMRIYHARRRAAGLA